MFGALVCLGGGLSRVQFVDELMPCLEKAVDQGQEARVLTVMKPGGGAPMEMDNAGLRKNFGTKSRVTQVPTWIDCMVEVRPTVWSPC